MKQKTDEPMAIPMWINGHPYLTVSKQFGDVRESAGNSVIRRTPCAGVDEIKVAVDAAATALPGWAALHLGERQAYFSQFADLVEHYKEHLAGLLAEEAGLDLPGARSDIEAVAAALRGGRVGEGGLVGATVAAGQRIAAIYRLLAPTLLAGGAVICHFSADFPGPMFALCELSSRAGLPGGVINLLYGDAETAALLDHVEQLDRVLCLCGTSCALAEGVS